MAKDEGYQRAERRIAEAQRAGAEELSLAMFGLTELPEALWQLTQLRTLDLQLNQLTALPEALGQLTQLQTLNVTFNQLTALPEALGQLTQLRELYLQDNRLTALPEALGQLTQLQFIRVVDNPLPAEILRLDKEDKLIGYLQELAQPSRTKRAAVDAPARFDEAKLLLVGPGDVGKSWLLQALQGKVPQEIGSTKGLEIARQPLDLPHSTEKGRTLHLNCWDFGGQDHYQITHQVFFSPKAIYLLVWKPRPGVDPDLVARLERIQLSAGRTARVFIVSTHADGKVPAIIGQDALRQRFGELIGGFHEIDSAKGPKGTGMAKLQKAIAQAVAQLEGMDLLFPPAWHRAQQAVRELEQPTLPFGEFETLCAEHGMEHENASALASIMDVQGNAVYFAEAPGKPEAGVGEAENLVVLNPEWLAKAVAFLLEDKETLHESGLLLHSRLPEIWHKDTKRGCPGYAREIHGYLLWLIWKFDIAYPQNAETSLVPELIHRNRPDDLRWTPAVSIAPDKRQATLIARVPQAPPAGLVPVLTAAVHPLRRVQCPKQTTDKLDRNWRDGFFLDTALRGAAFVELQDRDLLITVRDEYPADLARQVRQTLDQAVKARWPQLKLDYRVPCIGQKDGKPCPGTFRWERLEGRRGERMYCEECDDNLEVDKMLDGFDVREATVLQSIRELKDGQSDLLAVALRLYRDVLDPARAELERAPCMFTILPEEGGWNVLARLTEVRLNVTCWCEHPDGPHPGAPIGSHTPPDYLLKMPKNWVVKASPYISWAAMLLKAFVPLAGTVVEQGLSGAMPEGLKEQIDLMGKIGQAIPGGKLETKEVRVFGGGHRMRPEAVSLRNIHDALLAQVSEGKRWGDLRPVRTKGGDLLWLCAKHAEIQQPSPQKI